MKKNTPSFKWASALMISLASVTFANPNNPTVIEGDVGFSTSGNTLNVNSESARAIVEWEDFSIGSSETTSFNLPNGSSAILNRVTGELPSLIEGSIESNGVVYLINSYGVFLEQGSTINTNGFLGSALDINPGTEYQNFLDGVDMTFTGLENQDNLVTNTANITASNGDVVLMAYLVQNNGTTNVPNGILAVGAGTYITLQPSDNNRILIVPQTYTNQEGNGVASGAVVNALHVQLSGDGNAYEYAIFHDGQIHGEGTLSDNCSVTLTAIDGNLWHDGVITAVNINGVGGEINLRGVNIEVGSNSAIQASGSSGGGSINIGEGTTGIDDAMTVTIAANGNEDSLSSNALLAGNGGSVMIVADTTIDCFTVIQAKGASLIGNGGDISLLTPGTLDFTSGCANVSGGLLGSPGTLDPVTLTPCE